jgi:hypothetical protein
MNLQVMGYSAADVYLPLFIILLVFETMMVKRLERCHGDIYLEMGAPKFGDSNLGGAIWKLQKFLWRMQFLKLKDSLLSFLCLISMVGELALLYCFVQYDGST